MGRIRDYYRKNFLYESHRLVLPELRAKATSTCAACRFFVYIAGRTEKRAGCAALLPRYAGTGRRVPEEIPLAEVLGAVGQEGLQKVLAAAPERWACGFFCPRAEAER